MTTRSEQAAVRRPAVLAGSLVVLAVAVLVAALVLDLGTTDAAREATLMGWGSATGVTGLVLVVGGALVLARHPRHGVGWVLAALGLLWCLDGLAESWVAYAVSASPDRPGVGFGLWFVAQLGSALLLALPLVLVLYPDGRLPVGPRRRTALAVVAMASALPVALVFAPSSVMDFSDGSALPARTGMPELPLSSEAAYALLVGARAVTLLSLLLAVVLVYLRHRQATGAERVQLRWLVWAAVMCVLFVGVALVVPGGGLATILLALVIVVTVGSVTIGILRPDLTDVDALMGGTTVYAAVAGSVVAIDLLLLASLDRVLGERLTERQSILLVLLVAVTAYGPLRSWFGTVVRRHLVGRRADRYDVISDLAAQLERSGRVADQLPALTRAVASAFKLGFVSVEVHGHAGETLTATQGDRPPVVRELPIQYGGERVGLLVLSGQGLRSMLSRHDQELLLDVVRQGAVAVRSARLAADLQASREQLVLAREEDRRRIRRDLHDGLGPVLGGVAMRLDAAGNTLAADPELARSMVARSRQDITDALADVRRLVHDLRPPALDDLGLLHALRQQVERTRAPQLAVRLDATDVAGLPAAVEVAAYRIVSEAIANTVKHAGATECAVRLTEEEGALVVDVSDNGSGIGPDVVAGVGLRSLRERAEELGGRTEITCPAQGGTRVRAWLPVPSEGAA